MVNVVIDQFATYHHIWLAFNTKNGQCAVRLIETNVLTTKSSGLRANITIITEAVPRSDSIVIPIDWNLISGSDP